MGAVVITCAREVESLLHAAPMETRVKMKEVADLRDEDAERTQDQARQRATDSLARTQSPVVVSPAGIWSFGLQLMQLGGGESP